MATNPVPNFPIVDQTGRPTQYFYAWLLTVRGAVLNIDDLAILQALGEDGAAAIATSLARTVEGAALEVAPVVAPDTPDEIAGAFANCSAAFDSSDLELAAALGDRAPVAAGFPVIRDVLANIPTAFNAGDDGRIFEASDYRHRYRWNGSALAWKFDEGDASGFVVIGKPDGSAPNGGLWGLCDGSAYNIAQDSGTIVSVTTQNLTGGAFIKGDAPAAQQAAATPTWAAGAKTDTEATHTHSVDPPNTTSGNDSGSGTIVQSGAGATVAAHTHTHDTDIAAFTSAAGAAHAHNLTNANATMNAPSEANGGLPLRIGVRFYIRR